MSSYEEHLRETYKEKSDEEIVELRCSDQLTDAAYRILDAIISERGIDSTIVADHLRKQAEEKARRRQIFVAKLPRVEKSWKVVWPVFVVWIAFLIPSIVLTHSQFEMPAVYGLLFTSFALWFFYGRLASSLSKSVIGCVALAVLLPIFGSIIMFFVFYSNVQKARSDVDSEP